MIERWFPCAEVSEASGSGWGSGQSEKALFTWFAARPLAQAKAAVLTSLLPWPDDPSEQRRLQDLVRNAMGAADAEHVSILSELSEMYPELATVLDPFSGRAMIPLEAAHLGARAYGIDYSPVATIAGQLLADYPLRDWSREPTINFGAPPQTLPANKLVDDVSCVLEQVGSRFARGMSEFYPRVNGKQPWGYLWATTLPCQECRRRFPLTGSLVLRHPLNKKADLGQSYRIAVDRGNDAFWAEVHDGPPLSSPTLVSVKKGGKDTAGKAAVCPFCEHPHPKEQHTRLASEGYGQDVLLIAADIDERLGKTFRRPTSEETEAVARAEWQLSLEPDFAPGLSAAPNEYIPVGNNHTIQASYYGAKRYSDMMNPRQTLGFERLARIIADLGTELRDQQGVSPDYARALCGYAASVLVRKLRRSTRGAVLEPRLDTKSNRVYIKDIFSTEASISFSYDYFEAGLGDGPGTWESLADDTIATLRRQLARPSGRAAIIAHGSALALPFRSRSIDAVVTDPPYDDMIPYTDVSDPFYVWLKRALSSTEPELFITSHPNGVQEKREELIVKKNRKYSGDHRTPEHYDAGMSRAFGEARRVVKDGGVVSIVFGHGEPKVWHRLLKAISTAGLVLTGSWPAKTESSGGSGSANIVTTLTMACRPAPEARAVGRNTAVEAEVIHEVRSRIPMWIAAGLAPTDQLMASAGPAMEVVGRYEAIYDHRGEPVDSSTYLVIARRAVQEAAAIQIDKLPLEGFDSRTRFALFWVRLYSRSIAAKSEARWQALAADLSIDAVRGILVDGEKGVRFGFAKECDTVISDASATIDVAFAMAKAWKDGLDAVGQILLAAGRDVEDEQLWAALSFLSTRLPEGDPDANAWTALVRNRRGIKTVARDISVSRERDQQSNRDKARQGSLFDVSTAVDAKEAV